MYRKTTKHHSNTIIVNGIVSKMLEIQSYTSGSIKSAFECVAKNGTKLTCIIWENMHNLRVDDKIQMMGHIKKQGDKDVFLAKSIIIFKNERNE